MSIFNFVNSEHCLMKMYTSLFKPGVTVFGVHLNTGLTGTARSTALSAPSHCADNMDIKVQPHYRSQEKQILTIWHTNGRLIWLMPPAKTPNVRPVWKRKLRSMCQPFLLMRITLRMVNSCKLQRGSVNKWMKWENRNIVCIVLICHIVSSLASQTMQPNNPVQFRQLWNIYYCNSE